MTPSFVGSQTSERTAQYGRGGGQSCDGLPWGGRRLIRFDWMVCGGREGAKEKRRSPPSLVSDWPADAK